MRKEAWEWHFRQNHAVTRAQNVGSRGECGLVAVVRARWAKPGLERGQRAGLRGGLCFLLCRRFLGPEEPL